MRSVKHIALGAFLTLGVFFAVLYTSCSKDACKQTTCENNGSCTGGTCYCKPGIGGGGCETIYRTLYGSLSGYVYTGVATINNHTTDSTNISHTDANNQLILKYGLDSVYTRMQLTWIDSNKTMINQQNITLSNFSANGSDFVLAEKVSFDTSFLYSGSGSVNGNTISLTLVGTPKDSFASVPVPTITVVFSNLNKK